MEFAEYVRPIGISEGHVVWWSKEVTVTTLGKEKNFIVCKVSSGLLSEDCFIRCVYGDPNFVRRTQNWETIRGIGINQNEAWICVGDFNDISHHKEKIGGRRKDQHKIDVSNALIEDIKMEDLRYKGHMNTWSNNKRYVDRIMKRLNRGLGNHRWCHNFMKA